MSEEEYLSITCEATSEITVKGSRFIAHASPAESKDAAESYVAAISAKFTDATHNCFAYQVGVGDSAIIRFRDAGEPSGTAGRPILQAIVSKNLTNVALVVTRYFGGTKLGTGGLIRAYSGAAMAVLDQAVIRRIIPKVTLKLHFPYELTNGVHQVIERFQARLIQSGFDKESEYVVQIETAKEEDFRQAVQDISRGKVTLS